MMSDQNPKEPNNQDSAESSLTNCSNCSARIDQFVTYCPECGQKHVSSYASLKNLLLELFSLYLNVDGRLWRTLKSLLIPGKLTTQYFQGVRERYISPFRLFLIATLVHLALLNIYSRGNFFKANIGDNTFTTLTTTIKYLKDSEEKLIKSTIRDSTELSCLQMIVDSLEHSVNKLYLDTVPMITLAGFTFTAAELFLMPANEVAEKKGLSGFFGLLFISQSQKLLKQPNQFFQYAVSRLSWMIFFIVPFIALLMKVLYFRSKKYYIEHFIFSTHFHVFTFILMSVAFLVDIATKLNLVPVAFISSLIYTYLAMYRFYGQGWLKTGSKWLLLHLGYLFIGLCGILFLLSIGFILFD